MVDYAILLAKEQDFWANHTENICYFTPSLVVNKFYWKIVLFGRIIETVFNHVVTGILVHGILELFPP